MAVVVAVLFMLPAGVQATQPLVDGIVKVSEYDHSTVLGDGLYTLSWTVAGDMVWFGIQATTTIEFSRKRVTGDAHDKAVPTSGTLKVIWAIGSSDGISPHAAKGSATIDIGAAAPIVLTFTIGSTAGTRNGTPVALDAAPVIQNGRTLLPARFVAEQLGCAVGYDPTTKVVTVTYPKP